MVKNKLAGPLNSCCYPILTDVWTEIKVLPTNEEDIWFHIEPNLGGKTQALWSVITTILLIPVQLSQYVLNTCIYTFLSIPKRSQGGIMLAFNSNDLPIKVLCIKSLSKISGQHKSYIKNYILYMKHVQLEWD